MACVRAVTSGPALLTGRNVGIELAGNFNFDRPGYLEVFESSCPKDKQYEGLHYPLRAGERVETQTYSIEVGAGLGDGSNKRSRVR